MAASCTEKNIPARPFIQKKSANVMSAALAKRIEVESPTSVAAP